jgi:MoaA/NifB/PqqE/SkfB family radical SAM enzyme
VKGGFDRIIRGVMALHGEQPTPKLIARTVLQRANISSIHETIAAAYAMGFNEISFLGADVSSSAFNRATPWSADRAAEIRVAGDDLAILRSSIDHAVTMSRELFENGFVAGGRESLDRILQYYSALAGEGAFPPVRCNAPWVSAVLEPEGELRPCFFQPGYGQAGDDLRSTLNSPAPWRSVRVSTLPPTPPAGAASAA